MADRVLRGMRIGANSLETTEGVLLADRVEAVFICKEGHEFKVAFSTEAELPAEWDCRCGVVALLSGAAAPEPKKPVRPQRTHWDMLLERRSIEDLEVLLEEQLALLRAGKLRADTNYRKSA